ncbi:ABC transporter ATP-binding protein [Blastococcus sp. Marseille-P5729]|uniref:ABC transporter ATP-binding protein n=1 Tax=Blastococcus sp. Marseille-P5729 TaxID=2086582 RepID=UPI0018FF0519|nr:ABC transporter ATP-binding protein [Blastococcus sp. Marseille-P5729]
MNFAELIATDVSASYDRTEVVHAASLQLQPGRVTALIGPNGSGKSTLLRALSGLHPIDSGSVAINGPDGARDIATLRPRQLARALTLLSQQRPTPLGASVADVVGYGRFPHQHRWSGRDEGGAAAITRALRLTGVEDLAQQPVDQLSGGQRQRVWLASCLAQQTPVLLLDEPTNHLDLRYQTELLALVRELADAHSVAIGIVLHDLNHAAAVADEVALLVEGRIRAYGPPSEVLRPEPLSEAYCVDIDLLDDGCGRRRICALGSLRAPTPALAG